MKTVINNSQFNKENILTWVFYWLLRQDNRPLLLKKYVLIFSQLNFYSEFSTKSSCKYTQSYFDSKLQKNMLTVTEKVGWREQIYHGTKVSALKPIVSES